MRMYFRCAGFLPTITSPVPVRTSFPCLTPRMAQHTVGYNADFLAAAFHDDHFEAKSSSMVDVSRRENHVMCKVLGLCELLGEIREVMIVDQRQSSNHRLISVYRFWEQCFGDGIAQPTERFLYPRREINPSNQSRSSARRNERGSFPQNPAGLRNGVAKTAHHTKRSALSLRMLTVKRRTR